MQKKAIRESEQMKKEYLTQYIHTFMREMAQRLNQLEAGIEFHGATIEVVRGQLTLLSKIKQDLGLVWDDLPKKQEKTKDLSRY